MSGIYDAGGQVLYIQGKISGSVTIKNALIEANPYLQIFDTSVNIGTGCYIKDFSIMWYGAKSSNSDNYYQIQKTIDQCKNRFNMYVPRGNFQISKSLLVATGTSGAYQQTSIKIRGEASFWDNDIGSQITYTGNSYALGLQLNKGSEISGLVITGGWVSPGGTDSVYYNTSFANYTNQSSTGNGQGIWIDPDGNYAQTSGSTGCKFHDLKIQKFNTLIQISNGITQNGEIMIFENIQFGDAKVAIQTSQPQEKGNVFRGIYSWGSIHTIFSNSATAGNYYIDGANIAGRCVRLFNIYTPGYFPTYINNFYAENIGTIGTIYTSMPISISNSVFDFNYRENVGAMTLLTSNTKLVKFDNCLLRYYGKSYDMLFSGYATFENCVFSGAVRGMSGVEYINYPDSVDVPFNRIKMSIHSSK
jgi:hypothetical protein